MIEEKEILEGNRLIAEFMGGKYDKDTNFPIHPNDIWLPTHGIVNYTTINIGYGKILLYHSSWDWLIPVIKKIREIINVELNVDSFEEIRERKLTLNPYDYNIEQVYKAVVEFIKWYNQNKND